MTDFKPLVQESKQQQHHHHHHQKQTNKQKATTKRKTKRAGTTSPGEREKISLPELAQCILSDVSLSTETL